jgi:hypothetical protein
VVLGGRERAAACRRPGNLRLLRRRSRQARFGRKWWPEERLGALWVFSGRVRGSGVRGGVVERGLYIGGGGQGRATDGGVGQPARETAAASGRESRARAWSRGVREGYEEARE